MDAIIITITSGLPVFLAHFVATIGVFAIAALLYTVITPHNEMRLIREGNTAAALSFGGALLGLAIPLGFCLAGSVNLLDILFWGGVILSLQLAVYLLIDVLCKGLSGAIKRNELAPTILLVSVKLSVAVINAAAISS